MKPRSVTHTLAYLAAAASAVLVIVWTEESLWRRADDLRNRAGGVISERFHHSEALEARLRSLNGLVLRQVLEPESKPAGQWAAEIREIRAWLGTQTAPELTGQEQAVLAEVAQRLEDYLVQLGPLLEGNLPHPSPAWRERLDQSFGELLDLTAVLATAERQALGEHLRGTEESLAALHRQMVLSSFLLLAMGGVLALLVYQGAFAPLRRRLRQAQAVLARQEKLSALGVLAAGIAHEIRNPLTSIKARLFTQQPWLAKGTEPWEDNVFITDEISRLEQIVRDFLAFARPAEPQFAAQKITQPLRELVKLLQPELHKSGIELRTEFLADPLIQADAGQLKQVVINLVKNSADALSAQGIITLRTRTETLGRGPHATVRAVVEVQDTGPGIPPEVRPRLFDPFYTTKPAGTGLGLSIAARILEKHQGRLEYSTTTGQGTTFRLVLPIATDSSP